MMTCPSEPGLPCLSVLLTVTAVLSAPSSMVGAERPGPIAPPPPAVQEGAREVVIRPGDTLWEIADRVLGDPLRWREILEANRGRVDDPRRLAPGTVLRVPGKEAAAGTEPPAGTAARGTAPPGAAAPSAGSVERDTVPRPRPEQSAFGRVRGDEIQLGALEVGADAPLEVVSPSDFASAPFLIHRERLRGAGRTVTVLDRGEGDGGLPRMVRGRDRVLLELGGWPAEPGELYQAFRWGRSVADQGSVGRPVAVLELERVRGDTAEARVRARYGAYRVGDPVAPLPPIPDLDGTRLREVEDGLTVRLAGFERARPIMAPTSRVFLEAGEETGLHVGDELVVLARGNGGTRTAESSRVLARLRVVRTTRSTSTATVLRLRTPQVEEGAVARLVARRTKPERSNRGDG